VLFCRFLGTYLGEDVAVKVLRAEHLNNNVLNEFSQEVYILRYLPFYELLEHICDVVKYPIFTYNFWSN
jgi:hypothetical protein